MKRTKRLLSLALMTCMTVSLIPQTASADHIGFGDRGQAYVSSYSGGKWGTMTLSSSKILAKGEGEDLASIPASKSVFNQFKYNRGKDFYDYASDKQKFVYDKYSYQSYGPSIGTGQYLYAVYDEGNDKGVYKVDFAANFDSGLRQLIQKGDLEVAIVAEANNYNGSTNQQRGIAQLRFYGSGAPILHEITTSTDNWDGTRTVSAGWYKPTSEMTCAMMNIRSERNKFTRNFNKSYVANVRVFLRDNGAPSAKSCKISGGNFEWNTNVNGKKVYTAKVGSTIEYVVQFDEQIKVKNTDKLKLRLKASLEKDTDSAKFDADFDRVDGDKIYFKYKVEDGTDWYGGVKVTADAAKLINAKECITDIAGNKLENDSVSFTQTKFSGVLPTVDDTYTGYTSDYFSENTKKPYSAASSLASKYIVYGSLPQNVYNGKMQPTVFSESSTQKPIFRIVLDDEIQKQYLNENTKLKLAVYDKGRRTYWNVYANLICAGIVGVKDNDTNGIKSDAYTELYFEYTPKEMSGYDVYQISFAGEQKGDYYVMDDDLITCNGSKIKNISGAEVSGAKPHMKVEMSRYGDLPPFNNTIIIDTTAPRLTGNKISTQWAKSFTSNASLEFYDADSFANDAEAFVKLVYYNEKGVKTTLPVQAGSKITSDEINLAAVRNGSAQNVRVDLSEIKLSDSYKADYQLYLEYRIADRAGNVATNADEKNIEVYLDNTAPVVEGVERDEQVKYVTVKYNVTDTGVGKIDPLVEYKLKNYTKNTAENLKSETSDQSITVTALEDSLDYWEIDAYFSDTVGNKMKVPAASGSFMTALRSLKVSFEDSEESVVSDVHHITADTSQLPRENATFKVKYGWKRGPSATLTDDAKTEVTFKSADELAKFDFASEEVQRKYNSGNLFDGEFTFAAEVVMLPEDSRKMHMQTFYFDINAPEGAINVSKNRSGVNQSYKIGWEMWDDSAEYKNGAYVWNRNIKFESDAHPEMNIYIDGELAKTYSIWSIKQQQTIDFKKEFGGIEKYENAKTAYAELVFEDKFGHKTTVTGEEMAIDLKNPTIEHIEVEGENIHPFASYGEDAYLVNSLSDIRRINAFFDDNSEDILNITYGARKLSQQTADYDVTIDGMVDIDYQYRWDDCLRYEYTITAEDMGGNSVSRTVVFVIDYGAPEISYMSLQPITQKTNAESVELAVPYYTDSYETLDDIEIKLTGDSIAELDTKASTLGRAVLKITDNGSFKLKTRDAVGKTAEKEFKVTCFDREKPTITYNSQEQKPDRGDAAAKYGSVTMTATDNVELKPLAVAITKGEPQEGDFFTDAAEHRAVGSPDAEGNYTATYEAERYFGNEYPDAFAKLVPINPIGASGAAAASGYKLSYGALPDGKWQVWARVSDGVGNVTTEKIADITTTYDQASHEVEYTPGSDYVTGGSVTVSVKTDIRTRLLYGSDGNIEAMQTHAKEMRQKGYTYTYEGVTKTLSFDEALATYRKIAEKYVKQGDYYYDDEEQQQYILTDEEKYLVRYSPNTDNEERYSGFLGSDRYIDPEGDLADYLFNQCLCGSKNFDGRWNYFDVDTESGAKVGIDTSSYWSDIYPKLDNSGLLKKVYADEIDPETSQAPQKDKVDLVKYQDKIDTYNTTMSEQDLGDAWIENPFCYNGDTVTLDELHAVFGEDFDLSLVTEASEGGYTNPFGSDYRLSLKELETNPLYEYMTEYIADGKKYYKSPFKDSSSQYDLVTYEDVCEVLNAIPRLQGLREAAAEKAADKYVRSYISVYGNVFSTEHTLTFDDNVDREYTLIDEGGRAQQLPIEIDWIDHTKPNVPAKSMKLYIGDDEEEFTGAFTNAAGGRLVVELPTDGIYARYRLANLPEGAVGTPAYVTSEDAEGGETSVQQTTRDGSLKLYTGFTLAVSENGTVSFDVLSVEDAEETMYPQVYTVKCFDREAPTYELLYSPARPTSGADVNTDVTVSLTDVMDNCSGVTGITIEPAMSHTFTKNGKYTFTVTDQAGNKAEIPVTVDYIDKTPTELEVKFMCGDEELTADEVFDLTSDEADYKNTVFGYAYKGVRLNENVTVMIYNKGELVQSFDITDSDKYTYTYTRANGSKGTVEISGVLFDKIPPEAEVEYEYIAASSGQKDKVRANITLKDRISADDTPTSENIKLVSASGSDDSGARLTIADVTDNKDGTMSMTFNNNGNAALVFEDAAGNTTELAISVTNLDRTAPRAFISYSKETPTNTDVIAYISMSELADYQLYDEDGQLLRDYAGAFSTYINYTFDQNATRVFKFRDAAGNETEGLLATVSNIDKTAPKLTARVLADTMLTDSGELVSFVGAATIELTAVSEGDTLVGDENDTILLQNAVQSRYHSVLGNGRYGFKYMDTAGNFDVLYVDVDTIDTELPTATTTGNPTEWTNVPPTITVTPNRKTRGASAWIYQNGVKLPNAELTPTENGTYTFTLMDDVGNSSTHKVEVKYVDTAAPQLTISPDNEYKGNKDIYIKAGEFNKDAFEQVTAYDGESGIAANTAVTVDYTTGGFNANEPGEYPIYFKISDIAGNETVLTRKILVMGPDDVYAAINGQLIIPGTQANYWLGEKLKLSFVNAEGSGSKVSYAFKKGYYNGAQLKGADFKVLADPADVIDLEAKATGMYTLFLQTENRRVMVMYVFISG